MNKMLPTGAQSRHHRRRRHAAVDMEGLNVSEGGRERHVLCRREGKGGENERERKRKERLGFLVRAFFRTPKANTLDTLFPLTARGDSTGLESILIKACTFGQ